MNIGIAGIGFVGDAIQYTLSKKENITLKPYDKYKNGGIGQISDLLDSDWVFLSLPTLFNETTKQYDKTAIYEVCEFLSSNNYPGIVIVKSTIEPETSEYLATTYDLKVVHNPEFLTARTARSDFENQLHVVLGFTSKVTKEEQTDVVDKYRTLFPNADISVVTSLESELMKMYVNNFYAIKVQVFTEFYLLCNKVGADYGLVRDLMLKNGWISPHHTTIPGPDGELSYGGMCFPKDTQALLAYMEEQNSPADVLKACIQERNLMRKG
jgi:UDPglucose 6-dehydrogenase